MLLFVTVCNGAVIVCVSACDSVWMHVYGSNIKRTGRTAVTELQLLTWGLSGVLQLGHKWNRVLFKQKGKNIKVTIL